MNANNIELTKWLLMSILTKGNIINTGESLGWAERRIFHSRLKQHQNSKFKFQNYPHFVSNSTSSYIGKRKLGALIFHFCYTETHDTFGSKEFLVR